MFDAWSHCRALSKQQHRRSSKESFKSSVLTVIPKGFSTDCNLHEAISLDNPHHTLILLADRFPCLLTQVNSDIRYPVHIACAFGASPRLFLPLYRQESFICCRQWYWRQTPIHHLCQNTWKDFWGADLILQLVWKTSFGCSIARRHQLSSLKIFTE